MTQAMRPLDATGPPARIPAVPPTPSTAREEKRAQVMYAALGLFMVKGYTATTIDDVVRATGLARRTFFRYFAGKDDIVLSNLDDHREAFVHELESRPGSEMPFVAIYRSMMQVTRRKAHFESTSGLALRRLIAEAPELKAACFHRNEGWIDAVARALVLREGPDLPTARALLIARVARAAMDAAGELWVASNGTVSHLAAFDETFRALVDIVPSEGELCSGAAE